MTFVVIMSKEGDLPKLPIKNRKIGTIGVSLIAMGLSLLFIYILWASFGHIGPSFSSDVLNLQQSTLRAQYHLPEEPIITDPTVLQTPPSLRQFLTDNATSVVRPMQLAVVRPMQLVVRPMQLVVRPMQLAVVRPMQLAVVRPMQLVVRPMQLVVRPMQLAWFDQCN